MDLLINGEKIVIEQNSLTVSELLKIKDVDMPDMVSVQINGDFIDREEFLTRKVVAGDEIDFLYFMGGGSRCRELQQR